MTATKLVIKRAGDGPDVPPLAESILTEPLITIGSDTAAHIRLNGQGVAAEQLLILNEESGMLLINRAEGTVLNDEPLPREARRPLAQGDHLRVGRYVLSLVHASANTQPLAEAPQGPPPDQREARFLQPQQPPQQPESERRNFASILDSLRTEEDSFHLSIEGGPYHGQRVIIENKEMPLGWDATGQRICFDAATAVATRAVLRKDWTSVIIESLGTGMIAVNGEPVEGTRPLRNGDRIVIVPTAVTAAYNQVVLVFHEPASLLVLDTLLPQKLPPPVAATQGEADAGGAALVRAGQGTEQALVKGKKRASFFSAERRFFGYFTLMEMLLMAVGTLVTAALIFLVLEYL